MGLLKKVWIPLLLVAVLAVSGLVVSRLHTKFGSENLNANAGAGIEIVQFNPKVLVYEVYGPPGTSAELAVERGYERYLREKMNLTYPVTPSLKQLLDVILTDGRSEVLRVITIVSRASLSVTTPLPIEANRPSVDSLITTRSMPFCSAPTIGRVRSSSSRSAYSVGADAASRHSRVMSTASGASISTPFMFTNQAVPREFCRARVRTFPLRASRPRTTCPKRTTAS